MSKLKIKPLGDMLLLELEEAKLGALDSSSVKTGVEWAKVIEVGPEVTNQDLKGKTIFVKGWSVDVIQHEGKDYYFTSESRKGICAIVTT